VRRDGLPVTEDGIRALKMMGFTDARLAKLTGREEPNIRRARLNLGVTAQFKRIDTCAAEFEAQTPYMYSTYEHPTMGEPECEARPSKAKKVVILGGGPNRIGQGIEFDYCCCHACFALSDAGYETIMVNCNPETVSTDYDTSDRLYFEPLTFEHVMEILRVEQENGTLHGVIVQFGGQTPLKLANALHDAGIPILGTTPDAIDLAEDRERFQQLVQRLGLKQPENAIATTDAQAKAAAETLGYPLVIRPSYVLGGRAMEIVRDTAQLDRYIRDAVVVSGDSPVLLDSYLDGAVEVDVDALCDGEAVHVAGIMQHIEEAGVHSGDSACSLPPHTLSHRDPGRDHPPDRGARPRAQRRGPDERAVRGEGPRDLPDRGEPPRLAHRAFRGQGDRQRHRLHRRAAHGRRKALRLPVAKKHAPVDADTPSSRATRCRSPISASRGSR
jgi:carbamoyl-phosphate synthase large subunit